MPEEKLINTKTTVDLTVSTISIFTEYVEGDYWLLRSRFWDDEGIWVDTAVWID